MRRLHHPASKAVLILLAMAGLAPAGCQSDGSASARQKEAVGGTQTGTRTGGTASQPSAPDATASARDYADRIANAMTGMHPPAAPPAGQGPPDITAGRSPNPFRPPAWLRGPAGSGVMEGPALTGEAEPRSSRTSPASSTASPPEGSPTLKQLAEGLVERLRVGKGSDLDKALAGAAVGMATGERSVSPDLLAPLTQRQRGQVRRYRQALTVLRRHLVSAQGRLDRQTLARRLDDLFGHRPIRIRTLELCRGVSGYGVYQPFDDHTFLAGRDHRMILYTELDQFRPAQNREGRWTVNLKQEVVLYNGADGLAVWRQKPVRIEDESRNRRRDFFTVQMLTLPARLGVGKYILKVRVTDLNGGSVHETTTPLRIVADEDLAESTAEAGNAR